jgi:predicted  nucleic acid-binding Zn-ribbon protein
VTKERATLAAAVPADLLKLYEKLRAQQDGVGAARLYQRRCEGCREELAITEMNEVRAAAPDAVMRCENCRRILVRTPESGL